MYTRPEAARVGGSPSSLRELKTTTFPTGLIANVLLNHEKPLRTMCFIDNEFGTSHQSEIDAISTRIVRSVNSVLASTYKRIRILSVFPFERRHHHILVEWIKLPSIDDENQEASSIQELIANVYERSKRPEDEEEERIGPRRGGKGKSKRQRKKEAEDALLEET